MNRSPRSTYAETGRLVKVMLDYDAGRPFSKTYRIAKIANEIAVVVQDDSDPNKPTSRTCHVGDYLTEEEASDLLTEPGLEVTVVPAKE